MRRYMIGALLVTGILGSAAGCAARVRIYDEPRRDYHRWDSREDQAYREFLRENRREYREFRLIDRRSQEEYWEWRHRHPDRR